MSLNSRYSVSVAPTDAGTDLRFFGQPLALEVDLAPFFMGPPGPPGPGGTFLETVAVGPISALRVVAAGGAGAELVNPASVASMARMIGVTVNAAGNGAALTVRRSGLMTDQSWSWTPAQPIFCGAGGVLTHVAPTSVAIRQVAVAVSATTILVDLSDLVIME